VGHRVDFFLLIIVNSDASSPARLLLFELSREPLLASMLELGLELNQRLERRTALQYLDEVKAAIL